MMDTAGFEPAALCIQSHEHAKHTRYHCAKRPVLTNEIQTYIDLSPKYLEPSIFLRPTSIKFIMLKTQKSSVRSVLGAPSQHKQSSRKGKRAWRKNVDIEDVEKGLENIRSEERATGSVFAMSVRSHNSLSSFQDCSTKNPGC